MTIVRRFMQSVNKFVKVYPDKFLKGRDKYGNKYYEIHPQTYLFGIRKVQRIIREVEPTNVDQVINDRETLQAGKRIPYEWESWLRKKRDDPPSTEEQNVKEINYLKMQERVKAMKESEEQPVHNVEKLTQEKYHSSTHSKEADGEQEVEAWKPGKK